MKHVHPHPIAVVEWSPGGCRGFDPASNRLAVGSTIADVLSQLDQPKQIGLAIGRRHAFVRSLRLPNVPKADALAVLRLQLDQHFPVSGAELCYDLAFLDDVTVEGRQSLVVATRAETLRAALQDLESAGAKAVWVVPAALGSPLLANDLGVSDAVVVEPSPDGTAFDVIRDGSLTYSRVSPQASGIEAEVQRTLAAAGAPSSPIVAASGLDVKTAAFSVKVPTLELLANRYDRAVNLQLPEVVAKLARAKGDGRRRLAVLLWAATALVAGMIYLDRDDAAREVAKAKQTWQRDLKRLQTNETLVSTRLGTNAENAEFLSSALEPRQYSSDVVLAVVNQVPAGVWLTGVNFERGRPIQLRGTAKTNESVAQLVSRLSMSPRFRDVKLVFANNGAIDEEPVVQFAVSAHVVGNLPLIEKKGATRS